MASAITLIQPRHIYAPDPSIDPVGHIYMPTSLLAAATVLLRVGFSVSIVDENIESGSVDRITGINLLGAPYIPSVIEFQKRLNHIYGDDYLLLIGGQVVSDLTDSNIKRLFGKNVVNGNNPESLSKALMVDEQQIPRIENLSLIPAYSLLLDDSMYSYLSNEFGFYLSQGCKYWCSFCAAKRSGYNPVYGKVVEEREVYRDLEIAAKDLDFLIRRGQSLGIQELHLYLSNLDLFQSPDCLNVFAKNVKETKAKYEGFNIVMRGLSNVRSFLYAHDNCPHVIQNMIEAGLKQIGFGVDGATSKVWKETRKPQTESECIRAIVISKTVYGLTPETLMVFGHNRSDDETSLHLAYEFVRDMKTEYGALPRPHVAKDIVPGNNGWYDRKNRPIVEKFLNAPCLFQNLDFTAVPSPITHPNQEFRRLVTKYYLEVCNLSGCLTQDVLPVSPEMSISEFSKIKSYNLRKYDI